LKNLKTYEALESFLRDGANNIALLPFFSSNVRSWRASFLLTMTDGRKTKNSNSHAAPLAMERPVDAVAGPHEFSRSGSGSAGTEDEEQATAASLDLLLRRRDQGHGAPALARGRLA
jgi:hypothetical protein